MEAKSIIVICILFGIFMILVSYDKHKKQPFAQRSCKMNSLVNTTDDYGVSEEPGRRVAYNNYYYKLSPDTHQTRMLDALTIGEIEETPEQITQIDKSTSHINIPLERARTLSSPATIDDYIQRTFRDAINDDAKKHDLYYRQQLYQVHKYM